MTDRPPAPRADARTAAERARDHAALERLTASLLPALVAKLGSSGLGELEVREDPGGCAFAGRSARVARAAGRAATGRDGRSPVTRATVTHRRPSRDAALAAGPWAATRPMGRIWASR